MRDETKEAHVAKLIETALTAGLRGAEWCSYRGLAWCAEAYNGIGPEFFPADVREEVTKYLQIFEPAAFVHDCQHKVSDGTRESFELANGWFLENCLTLADLAYPWYNWKRYRARAVAYALHECVSGLAGWVAWCDSHARRVATTGADAPEVAQTFPSNTTKPPEGTY